MPRGQRGHRCDAVLFDMDGVLVDSREVIARTWRRWAERHGLDASGILAVAHGRRTSDTLRLVAPRVDLAAEVAWLDRAEAEDLDGIRAIRGAPALLAALQPDEWAVVTSADRTLAQRRLAAAGLPVPAVLVASEDILLGKPDPEGYRKAAASLGRRSSECVVLEDAPAGIAAGRAAGCKVIGVATTHEAGALEGAAFVVPDLSTLRVIRTGGRLEIETAGSVG